MIRVFIPCIVVLMNHVWVDKLLSYEFLKMICLLIGRFAGLLGDLG